ncbi:hypothetical protein AVEN_142591-1 [Araneus ventricosus]|uniref:Uncharacterized protein n=1 Tax=Araneus ventricosus TaxID=182803 RepID=A0A4Y2CFW8_ARAVE|nr:hypothetical protein AVEN_142591-1 [Araneus ventricosus]
MFHDDGSRDCLEEGIFCGFLRFAGNVHSPDFTSHLTFPAFVRARFSLNIWKSKSTRSETFEMNESLKFPWTRGVMGALYCPNRSSQSCTRSIFMIAVSESFSGEGN